MIRIMPRGCALVMEQGGDRRLYGRAYRDATPNVRVRFDTAGPLPLPADATIWSLTTGTIRASLRREFGAGAADLVFDLENGRGINWTTDGSDGQFEILWPAAQLNLLRPAERYVWDVMLTAGGTTYLLAAAPVHIERSLAELAGDGYAPVLLFDRLGGVSYIGEAKSGAATSAAVWRLRRFTYTAGLPTLEELADGDPLFDNVWDNRLRLSYR